MQEKLKTEDNLSLYNNIYMDVIVNVVANLKC